MAKLTKIKQVIRLMKKHLFQMTLSRRQCFIFRKINKCVYIYYVDPLSK